MLPESKPIRTLDQHEFNLWLADLITKRRLVITIGFNENYGSDGAYMVQIIDPNIGGKARTIFNPETSLRQQKFNTLQYMIEDCLQELELLKASDGKVN